MFYEEEEKILPSLIWPSFKWWISSNDEEQIFHILEYSRNSDMEQELNCNEEEEDETL